MARDDIFSKKNPAKLLESRKEKLNQQKVSDEKLDTAELSKDSTEIKKVLTSENKNTKSKKKPKNSDFEKQILYPESKTSKGLNVRVKVETHGLLKGISMVKEQEIYGVVEEALRDYVEKQPENVKKEILDRVKVLSDLGMIKL